MYYRIQKDGHEVTILQEQPGIYVNQYSSPLAEYSASLRLLSNDEYPSTETDLLRLLQQEGKHQLAGMPIWIQREEHLPCIICGGRMEYIAMVDSDLYLGKDRFPEKGHMFGDEGRLYTFICHTSNILANKAQGL